MLQAFRLVFTALILCISSGKMSNSYDFVAIVTGANRGIGLECIRRLAEQTENSLLILTSRNLQSGETAKKTILNSTPSAKILVKQLDITDSSSIQALVKDISENYGQVNVLINNAGFAYPMSSEVPFSTQARNTIDINYYGTKKMCEAFLPVLSDDGKIINVSSTSGLGAKDSCSESVRALFQTNSTKKLDEVCEQFVALATQGKHKERGYPGTAYGTSKFAVNVMSGILTNQHTIPVIACCPGFCRTNMTSGRRNLSSYVMWAAGYVIGQSAYEGADTPVWLALQPKKNLLGFQGELIRNRIVAKNRSGAMKLSWQSKVVFGGGLLLTAGFMVRHVL